MKTKQTYLCLICLVKTILYKKKTKTFIEKYEKRNRASQLAFPQFACFYTTGSSKDVGIIKGLLERNAVFPMVTRPFHHGALPLYIVSNVKESIYYFKLRINKEAFWRTFHLSEADGEAYYHQQIVLHLPLPTGYTFEEYRGDRAWRDFFRHLVDRNIFRVRSANVDNIAQVSNEELGVDIARQELRVMYQQAFPSQQRIFKQVIRDLQLESTVFVSGAAGTGKSFLLKLQERYYRIHGYHVCKMAPTGVAAHNINGQTMHRFLV